MSEQHDQFAASIASEAVEILEDQLLFLGGYCCFYRRAAQEFPEWQTAPGHA